MNKLKRRIEELEDEATRIEKETYGWTRMNNSRIRDLQEKLSALADYLEIEFVEVVPADVSIKVQPKKKKEKEWIKKKQ